METEPSALDIAVKKAHLEDKIRQLEKALTETF